MELICREIVENMGLIYHKESKGWLQPRDYKFTEKAYQMMTPEQKELSEQRAKKSFCPVWPETLESERASKPYLRHTSDL
ncbi:hypothetical protein HNV12_03110 [Methanococcoides sp. SA1]|nr:hypothetical protein [Methanococcoides sp. SA1]